jgi:hypothetical protein
VRTRLTALLLAIALVGITPVYLYVAPALQSRLIEDRTTALSRAAARYSPAIAGALRTPAPRQTLTAMIDRAALTSHNEVSLLAVNRVGGQPQISGLISPPGGKQLTFPIAYEAVRRDRPTSGTERAGTIAEAAYPVLHPRLGWVITYSSPVSNIVRNVAIARREILVVGAIALVLAAAAGLAVKKLAWPHP